MKTEPLLQEMATALDKAERMITYMACVFYRKDLQDYFPYGMADEVKAYIQDSGKAQDLLCKARSVQKELKGDPNCPTCSGSSCHECSEEICERGREALADERRDRSRNYSDGYEAGLNS